MEIYSPSDTVPMPSGKRPTVPTAKGLMLLTPGVAAEQNARKYSGILLGTSPFDLVRKDHVTVDVYYNGVKVKPETDGRWGRIEASHHAINTVNPIRRIVDVMSIKPNPEKSLIKLHLGDPTLTGTLPTHPVVLKALEDAMKSAKYNGYGPAVGLPEVREAIAESATMVEAPVDPDDVILTSGCSHALQLAIEVLANPGDNILVREAIAESATMVEAPVDPDDVILTSGCSHALQLAIEVLANPGDNILVPRPGFPLYATLMNPHGVEDRMYNLLPERGWEMDLEQLENLIDSRTRAIVVNNPSNPCGAVYTKEHLQALLKIAEQHKIPIIADEIYAGMTFGGAEFHRLASLTPKVPIIVTDGIAKRYLVPGWRLGWLIIHDRHGAFAQVKQGLKQLATKIVGPCAVVQGAIPSILRDTPPEFFEHTKQILEANAEVGFYILKDVVGLSPVKPNGAMYMMVGLDMSYFPDLPDELEFTKALIAEESIYCLPGAAFHYNGAIRLVMTYTADVTREACNRIKEFCERHAGSGTKRQLPPEEVFNMEDLLGDEDSRDASDIIMVALEDELTPGLHPFTKS